MMNVHEQVSKMNKLMSEGKTMEEALTMILTEVTSSSVVKPMIRPEERVEYIKSIDNIEALRKAIKVAYAKASKARKAGNTKALERAEAELEAGEAHLNELFVDIYADIDPVKRAREFGAGDTSVVTIFLQETDKEFTGLLRKLGLSNAALKRKVQAQPDDMSIALTEKLNTLTVPERDVFFERVRHNDQWVISIIREARLVDVEFSK